MLELERAREQLDALGLKTAATALDRWLEVAAQQNELRTFGGTDWTPEEELAARQER